MSDLMSPSGNVSRRSNLKIAAGAVVCDESILKGDITIGSKTIVHPRARIIAEAGPIVIGEGNIIEEMATIINSYSFFYSLKIAAGAVVCDESILKGDITIGSKTIVHPRARIIAEAGPIVIGEGNIIEEMATIINKYPPGGNEYDSSRPQIIGNYNVFEIDSICEALKVGDNNILETKALVSHGVELTNGCVIGAACSLQESDTVPENTVIYGSQCHRREMNDKPYPQVGQLDFLIRVLPNYHHLRKPNIKAVKNDPAI